MPALIWYSSRYWWNEWVYRWGTVGDGNVEHVGGRRVGMVAPVLIESYISTWQDGASFGIVDEICVLVFRVSAEVSHECRYFQISGSREFWKDEGIGHAAEDEELVVFAFALPKCRVRRHGLVEGRDVLVVDCGCCVQCSDPHLIAER